MKDYRNWSRKYHLRGKSLRKNKNNVLIGYHRMLEEEKWMILIVNLKPRWIVLVSIEVFILISHKIQVIRQERWVFVNQIKSMTNWCKSMIRVSRSWRS